MKFHITADKTHVWINVRNDAGDWLQLSVNVQNEFSAKAVRDQIEDGMFRMVKDIRASAYAAGWADAKAKRTKKTQFAGCINSDPKYVGY